MLIDIDPTEISESALSSVELVGANYSGTHTSTSTIQSTNFFGVETNEVEIVHDEPHNDGTGTITRTHQHNKTVTNDLREMMTEMRLQVHDAVKDGCDAARSLGRSERRRAQ